MALVPLKEPKHIFYLFFRKADIKLHRQNPLEERFCLFTQNRCNAIFQKISAVQA